MAINSNCDRISGGCGSGSPEETWLRSDLAAHPTECTIAMWHHARYSSGHDGDNTFMQTMWSDLFDAGVEIVLSGHSHDYERFAPQDDSGHLDNAAGIRQFVVGTGGAFFTGLGNSFDANSQAHQNTTFGVLKLTLRSDAYDWQFLPEAGKSIATPAPRPVTDEQRSATARILVGAAGFEPATSCSQSTRASQAALRPV